MTGKHRLGWRWSRPNDFNGPDQRPSRDTFMELQRFMTWPYVGLTVSSTFDVTGAFAPIPWTVTTSAAAPFVAGDPFDLYRAATSVVQVPQDFDTWLAIGSCAATFDSVGAVANSLRHLAWRINGVNTNFVHQWSRGVASGCAFTVPFMKAVRTGQTISIAAAASDGVDITSAEAWLYFLPLA